MLAAYENSSAWHERDISHSSSERILSMDATSLLGLHVGTLHQGDPNLTIFEDNMINIYATHGVIFTSGPCRP